MKTDLIFKLSAVAILTVSAFGHMHGDDDNYPGKGMNQQQKMNYSNHMGDDNYMMNGYMMGGGSGMMMGHGMMGGMMILPKIMMLDLTKEQQEKIAKIFSEESGMVDPSEAFTDKSFDAEKYSKAIQKNMDMMGKYHAQIISKIYALLTPKQKKDLKSLLDAQKVMQKNRNYHMMGR